MIQTSKNEVRSSNPKKWVRLKKTEVYGQRVTRGNTKAEDWEEIDPIVEPKPTEE